MRAITVGHDGVMHVQILGPIKSWVLGVGGRAVQLDVGMMDCQTDDGHFIARHRERLTVFDETVAQRLSRLFSTLGRVGEMRAAAK